MAILLSALPRVPFVQFWLGEKASTAISELLGTSVNVGRIDLGMFNRVILDDVLIKDQRNSPMLRVGRLSAKIDLLDLIEGKVSISSAQLFGAHAHLYRQDSLSRPNFQFVLDSLASRDTTSNTSFHLRVNSLIVRNSSFTYDQYDMAHEKDRISPYHLRVSDISTHLILKVLSDDSLNVNVKRLSFKEYSGLNVKKLAFKYDGGKYSSNIHQFVLQLPETHFKLEKLEARYDFQHFKETLHIGNASFLSVITPSDFSFLLPKLSNYSMPLSFNLSFGGALNHLTVPKMTVRTKHHDVYLNLHGWIDLLSHPLIWLVRAENISVSDQLLSSLQNDFDWPKEIGLLGNVVLQGDFSSDVSGEMTAKCQINTGAGDVDMQIHANQELCFDGHLDAKNVNLQQLLSDDDFGQLEAKVDVSGNSSRINVKGEIDRLDVNDYAYSHILLDGEYSPAEIKGKLKIDDPNLQTDIEGLWRKENKKTAIRLTGYFGRVVPKALHLSNKWGSATFSTIIDADFIASSLNDAQGTIDIDDFEMVDSIGTFQIGNVHVKSGFEQDVHFLNLKGDFGEARLKGNFDWATLPQSFVNYVAAKLPTLPGLPASTRDVNNNFNLSLQLSDTEFLKRLFQIPVVLHQPMHLYASVDDSNHQVNVTGSIPAFTYDDDQYNGGEIRISSPSDSMKCDLSIIKMMGNGHKMFISLQTTAADNNLATNITWDDHQQDAYGMSGAFNTITQLYKNEEGKPEAHVRILPSYLVMADQVWDIEPCDILYSTKNLYIDYFRIGHDDQYLIVRGMASEKSTDTLNIELKDVEVAYVLDLVNFHSVEFSGEATGMVQIARVLDMPMAWADLSVNHFCFEGGRMGKLHALANWNEENKQIDIDAIADDGPDAKTYISGYVSPVREYIDLDIYGRGTYIDFVHSFTESFLSGVTGHATGDVKLAGPLDKINLVGQLCVDGEATVTSIGTTYKLVGDTVTFVPDDIVLKDIRVVDKYENVGYLSGGIHHNHLTSLTFDLDVRASNLLAYDFHDFGESTFYGTAFVQGNIDLHGRPGEVTINCNVTPLKNTRFVYDAASDNVSNQEFIAWRDATPTTNPTYQEQSNTEKVQGSSTDIYINFLINTTPDAEIKLLMDRRTEDYITLYGSGTMRASFYNKGAFQMFGTYTVSRGTYGITIQNIINKNFIFQEGGTLVFGGNPMNAALNLQAVYTVNGVSLSDLSIGNSFSGNTVRVNCLMNISGHASAPAIDFDLDMPTVSYDEKQMVRSVISSEQEMNQQVLYLLGIGRFYTQGNNNATTQQTGQTSLAMQSLLSGTVSTQLNGVLSQILNSNDWNFGANISTGNEGWRNAEYEGLISGRMLNNRLLINGQFGYRDNAAQATPSFIGDFDIRYLLYPNGNLALKVYNQTNDRYFTRSSLNTQGIGLIMKKDFNGLGDLFRRNRNYGQ